MTQEERNTNVRALPVLLLFDGKHELEDNIILCLKCNLSCDIVKI